MRGTLRAVCRRSHGGTAKRQSLNPLECGELCARILRKEDIEAICLEFSIPSNAGNSPRFFQNSTDTELCPKSQSPRMRGTLRALLMQILVTVCWLYGLNPLECGELFARMSLLWLGQG